MAALQKLKAKLSSKLRGAPDGAPFFYGRIAFPVMSFSFFHSNYKFDLLNQKINTMKKLFTLMHVMMITYMASAQHTLLKGPGNIGLYDPTDKFGIGTNQNLNEKVVIQSLSGETPLALRGYSTQNNPFITLSNGSAVSFWRLFASADWWLIGSSWDSTSAMMSVKPSRGWIKFNVTGSFTRLIAPAATITTITTTAAAITTGITRNSTSDTVTINKFFNIKKNSSQPAATLGNFYISATDSCLYYYNGKAWKKFTVQ